MLKYYEKWFDEMSKLVAYANEVVPQGIRLVGVTSEHNANSNFTTYCGVFAVREDGGRPDCFDKFIAQN